MTRLSANTPNVQRAVASTPATSRADATFAPNDGGSQSGATAAGIPDIGGLSLADSDATDRGLPSPPRNGDARRMAEIVTIPQTVMHITVHAHNSPIHIHGGSGAAAAVPVQGTHSNGTRMLRGGMPNLPSPRRILRPTPVGAVIPPVAGQAPTPAAPAVSGSPQILSVPDSPVSETASLPAVAVDEDEDEFIAPPKPEHTGNWYAVIAGNRVGVWSDWLQMAQYVTGVSGNHHKSFPSRAEALSYYYAAKVDGAVVVIAK